MRVLLKLTLDCDPDAAWRALQSPAVFQEVSAPLLQIRPADGDFPTTWDEGTQRLEVSFLGLLPLGEQITALTFSTHEYPDVRILRDRGHGSSGLLAANRIWDHRMAVSAHPTRQGKTLYRDRLIVGAGLVTPAVWSGLWAFWQVRGANLQRLAPYWAFDPELAAEEVAAGDEPADAVQSD